MKIVIEYLDHMTYYKYLRQLEKEAELRSRNAVREYRCKLISQEL